MRFYEIIRIDEKLSINSSWIVDLKFKNNSVYITMSNGRVYQVHDIHKRIYNRWIKAPSKGQYWHQFIKGQYIVT